MRNALLMAVLMASLTLAGCLDDESLPVETEEAPEPAPVIEPTRALAHLGGNVTADLFLLPDNEIPIGLNRYLPVSTFEPTIGADAEGCLFYTHFQGTGAGTKIMKSCDQALTWEMIGPYLARGLPQGDEPCFRNSNDPFVHVDVETGRVFSSDLHALVSSTLHYTDDKGASWTCNVLGGGLPPGVHDHQSVTTATPRTVQTIGYDKVVYYCVNRVSDSWCSTSLTGGIGFGPAVSVFPGIDERGELNPANPLGGFCGGLTGHVEADNEGRVFFPRGHCGRVAVGISEDDGTTWTRVIIDSTTGIQGHEVRIAADEANNVYAFWMGADGLPYVSMSTDHGLDWTPPLMVAGPNVTATGFPAIEAGVDGVVVFTYVGMEHPMVYDAPLEEMHWNTYIGAIYNAHDEHPTIYTVTTNPKDDAMDKGRPCGTIRCGGFGDFIDITIDPDGRPWAAFADMCHGDCAIGNTTGNQGGTLAVAGTFATGRSLTTGMPLPPLMTAPEQ